MKTLEQETINWTWPKLKRFKLKYNEQKDQDAVFTFEGHQFYVGYAKYLIEFLEGQLPQQ